MGSGTGSGILDSTINYATTIFTGGSVGFDDDGFGTSSGVISDGGDSLVKKPIKDLTGATAAEEANEDARKRFEEEKAVAADQKKQNQAQSAANQLAASRSASSARGGVSNPSSSGQSRFSNLGSDESDFLGL